ncbi:DUF3592 domain-containing protein [Streptomyces sp. SS8]
MEAVFLIAGTAAAAVCLLCLRRIAVVLWLVARGERARGWCARRRMAAWGAGTDGVRGHRPEFVFAFRTPDGETVEFRDRPGALGYEEGAPVGVRYDPARPRRRATVAGGGTWGPLYVPALVAAPTGLLAVVLLRALALHNGLG